MNIYEIYLEILIAIYCIIQLLYLFKWEKIIDLFTKEIYTFGLSLWDVIYIIFFLPAIIIVYAGAGILCIIFYICDFIDYQVIDRLKMIKIWKGIKRNI